MLGRTHYVGGAIAGLGAIQYLSSMGLMIPDVPFLVQCAITYPAASYGSVFLDFDQSEESIPIKSPMSMLVHDTLIGLGARHRTWHTHGLDFIGGLCFLAIVLATFGPIFFARLAGYGLPLEDFVLFFSSLGFAILRLMVIGFCFGVLSHLVLDMFTRAGIPLLSKKKVHLRFVPDHERYAAGSPYELRFRKVLTRIFWCLFILMCYLHIPMLQELVSNIVVFAKGVV